MSGSRLGCTVNSFVCHWQHRSQDCGGFHRSGAYPAGNRRLEHVPPHRLTFLAWIPYILLALKKQVCKIRAVTTVGHSSTTTTSLTGEEALTKSCSENEWMRTHITSPRTSLPGTLGLLVTAETLKASGCWAQAKAQGSTLVTVIQAHSCLLWKHYFLAI